MTNLLPYLQRKFGSKLETHGDEIGIPCPTCDVGRKREWRLWFNVVKAVGTCYKCHTSFNPLQLIETLEDVRRAEAIRILAGYSERRVLSLETLRQRVVEYVNEPDEEIEDDEVPVMSLPREFISSRTSTKWPKYVLTRLGSKKTAQEYNVGWCLEGFYADRLIVPVYLGGHLVSFVARDMTGFAEKKVLYPKGTKTSRVLFNYDVAKKSEHIILTEGVLDSIYVGHNAVAVFGTQLSQQQLSLLLASKARRVSILFDGDEAGRKGAEKVSGILSGYYSGRVSVATLPPGADPDELSHEALALLIEQSAAKGPLERAAKRLKSL